MRSVLVLPLLILAAAACASDVSVLTGVPKAGTVPEPASVAALAVGAIGLLRRYKKA